MLYGKKIFDWSKENKQGKRLKDLPIEDQRVEILKAASNYVKGVYATPVKKQPISNVKMSGVDANLMGAAPIVLVMSDTIKTPDRGYELLFDEVDMRNSSNDTFEVMDVSGGVVFYQHDPGTEAKLSKVPSSAKTAVGMLRFTGGLNILDDWLRFNKYYLIDRLFADVIKKWFGKRATVFYGLVAALSSGVNQAFDTDDATTINNACAQILEDLEAKGFEVDENAEFIITCNPKQRFRILKALAASFLNPNSNINQVVHNVSAVVATTKIANTSYYVSLPGEKNQRGEWEDMNMRPAQRNELVLGAANIWTGAYNGIIGEAKQHRRCALS